MDMEATQIKTAGDFQSISSFSERRQQRDHWKSICGRFVDAIPNFVETIFGMASNPPYADAEKEEIRRTFSETIRRCFDEARR
jgi:hypothetical protein